MAEEIACREASRLLSAAFERELSGREIELLRQHLDECLDCRNFETQLQFVHHASQRFRSGD